MKKRITKKYGRMFFWNIGIRTEEGETVIKARPIKGRFIKRATLAALAQYPKLNYILEPLLQNTYKPDRKYAIEIDMGLMKISVLKYFEHTAPLERCSHGVYYSDYTYDELIKMEGGH